MKRCLLNKPDNNCVHLIFKRILKRSAAMITEEELSKNKLIRLFVDLLY